MYKILYKLEGKMKVLQCRPAWALHAMLRYLRISYDCENVESSSALGQQLPILIDDRFVLTECDALEYLLKTYATFTLHDDEAHDQAYLTAFIRNLDQYLAYLSSPSVETSGSQLSIKVQQWNLGKFLELPHELWESVNSSQHVDGSLVPTADAILNRLLEGYETFITVLNLHRVQQSHTSTAQSLVGEDMNSSNNINSTDNSDNIITSSAPIMVKAALFGHLMETMLIPNLSTEIRKHPKLSQLEGFLKHAMKELFTMEEEANDELRDIWQRCNRVIATNIHVRKCRRQDYNLYADLLHVVETYEGPNQTETENLSFAVSAPVEWTNLSVDWTPQSALLKPFFEKPIIVGGEVVEGEGGDSPLKTGPKVAESNNNTFTVHLGGVIYAVAIFGCFLSYGILTTFPSEATM